MPYKSIFFTYNTDIAWTYLQKKLEKYYCTQALPYANAPLHLGHILEAVQTDIWTRFQNLNGNECCFFVLMILMELQ
jgi:leucyl-tRNA synthetase